MLFLIKQGLRILRFSSREFAFVDAEAGVLLAGLEPFAVGEPLLLSLQEVGVFPKASDAGFESGLSDSAASFWRPAPRAP